jgi:Tfp pilus assembly protein PilZ
MQTCGVLVAPSAGMWRARIVTYPKGPWMIPGGRGTVRFSGSSSNEAEARAVAYVHAHCAERGWTWNDVIPLRRKGDGKAIPERRKRRSLPIRFATADRAPQLSTVVNLSEGGLFLASPDPLPTGTLLRLEIEIYGSLASLEGTVAWTRLQLEPGRPRGMGIVFTESPAVWVSFVRGLP